MINIPISIPNVPSYSQFHDITPPSWQKVGCGITSLAMIINFYKPAVTTVDTLLKQGISLKAYDSKAGWIYKGLIKVANKYEMVGQTYDLGKSKVSVAFDKLKSETSKGPVIASVHYKFDPKSTIPHLVVIDGISDDTVYYNDPAAPTGRKQIPTADFLKGWKKRFITIRPA